MSFSTADARFVGTVLEGLAFGIYAVIFVLYLQATWKASKQAAHRSVEAVHYALCFLFLVATTYFSFDVVLEFFTLMRPLPLRTNANGNIGVESAVFRVRLNVLLSVAFSIADFLSQTILIYRCWIIWNRKVAIVVFPILLSVTSLLASLILSGELGVLGNSQKPPPSWFLPLGTAGFSLSLAANALVTVILVGGIWRTIRQTRKFLPTHTKVYTASLHPIGTMFIQSGILMVVAQTVYVLFFKLNTSPFWMVEGPVVMIYGITPTLLAVCVPIGKTYGTQMLGSTAETPMSIPKSEISGDDDSATMPA